MQANISEEASMWTMRELYYAHINQLMILNTKCALINDTRGWYRSLRALMRMVCGQVDKERWDELDKELMSIKALLFEPRIVQARNSFDLKNKTIAENKSYDSLDMLEPKIYHLMSHLIMPSNKLSWTKDKVYKKMGIIE